MDSFTFTVGKLDAGMAILIGDRAHLIEFPSLLLPPGVTSGSIVNIAVHRNLTEEKRQRREFWELQDRIFDTFGIEFPKPPELQVRNITQTSVTLEWPPLELATATLRSLDIYRNGQRLAVIPQPLHNTSTKLSGLEQNTNYTFQLILRTTAGTYPSNVIKLKTHTMTDTSGICVCFGTVADPALLENAKAALSEMKAKWSDKVQIDTTHFVCTTPAATPIGASVTGGTTSGPGVEYQKALQASIPIVLPHWVLACNQAQKMVPISSFGLGSTPPENLQNYRGSGSKHTTPATSSIDIKSNRSVAAASSTAVSTAGASTQRQPGTAPDVPAKAQAPPSISTSTQSGPNDGAPEEPSDGSVTPTTPGGSNAKGTRRRQGTMQKDFRFPSPSPTSEKPPPLPTASTESTSAPEPPAKPPTNGVAELQASSTPPLPKAVDIPPPIPVQKEKSVSSSSVDDDEVGETVEVDLS